MFVVGFFLVFLIGLVFPFFNFIRRCPGGGGGGGETTQMSGTWASGCQIGLKRKMAKKNRNA